MNNVPAIEKHQTSLVLAILPFENLSVNPQAEIFCKSFSLDLINELAKFRQFQIIGQQTILDFQNQKLSALETDYLIHGSFRSDGNIIKLNAQLINSQTNQIQWANRFESEFTDLFKIQSELLAQVVSSLQEQLKIHHYSVIRKKTTIDLRAYEFWLYGMEELKKGSMANDKKARELFRQAIEIDSDYSLAYSGMSLSYFNEWSCQLWERWEISKNGAFEWAEKAIELDEQNYLAAAILGRTFLYKEAFETAEHYSRKSLRLNSNDTDTLILIASNFVYLKKTEEALSLYQKAIRLNPANVDSYNQVGILIMLELGKYEEAMELALRSGYFPWVDAPAFVAAVCFYLKDYDRMHEYWKQYLIKHKQLINGGEESSESEALQWMINVNPFKEETSLTKFWNYISNEKLKTAPHDAVYQNIKGTNLFQKNGKLWDIKFVGNTFRLPEVKGFLDLQKLLASPNEQFHCAELMDSVLDSSTINIIDEKTRTSYFNQIKDLQHDIQEAEESNDLENASRLNQEYEILMEHLGNALNIHGKKRKTGSAVEKARSAVTWRIRNAISKIEKEDAALGKHLSNSIKTGTLCSYSPEQHIEWEL